jgi:hypothetical protein
MRTVARYSLTASAPEGRDALQDYINLHDRIDVWLAGKGKRIDDRRPEEVLEYPDGRRATVARSEIDLGAGGLREIVLSEPMGDGAVFETRLTIGLSGTNLGVLCELRVGGREEPLGPIRFDANSPRVLRELLSYDLPWTYGSFPLARGAVRFRGNAGGDALAQLLTNPRRLLPVVAISEDHGLLLHPGIAEAITRDLASLAVVGVLDEEAAWRLTRNVGADGSCYNGAIRLYWPGFEANAERRTHPLWTVRRLLDDVPDTAAAATRIRQVLRRRVMSASAFAIREPVEFELIRAEERKRRYAAEREKLTSPDDLEKLAESYAKEAEELRVLLVTRDTEIETLRAKVTNLELALRWQESEAPETLEPDTSTPILTVRDAVERARAEHPDSLVFGPAVEEGLAGLGPDAGPPDKVYSYLTKLGRLSRARGAGPLGTSPLEWLKQQNVSASQEGEGVKRAWGGREYDWHLKPAENVPPDRCVRIYFAWDESSSRIIVGWVGRHP